LRRPGAEEEIARLRRALDEAREEQAATADVLKVISRSTFDLQAVLDTLVASAVRLCRADKGGIVRAIDGIYRYVATSGYSPSFQSFVDAHPPAPGRGSVVGRAFAAKSAVQIPDVLADPEYKMATTAALEVGGFRATLGVPLMRDGEVVGVFALTRAEPEPFTERQMALVQTFADQAVIAIENVRLFGEVQDRNRELAEALEQQTATSAILKSIAASPTDIQPVLSAVAESAAQLCDAYDATILMPRGNALAVAAHHGPIGVDFTELPLERGVVTGRAFLDRKPVHVHDLMAAQAEYPQGYTYAARLGFRTILAMPFLRENEAFGALLIRRNEVRPFTGKQIGLLATFADQAVIAIENVRLFEEVQARNREVTEALEQQTGTSDILRAISTSMTDVKPVFETIAESAARLCAAQFCFVYGYDGALVHLEAHHGLPPEAVESMRGAYPTAPDRSSAGARAILSGAVEQIPDIFDDADYALGETARILGSNSVLAVPMLRDGIPVGAIAVDRAKAGYFPDRQIQLLQTFADQAVIAIENVRLFEEVQARTAELGEALRQQTATADVLKVISRSAFDLKSVLQTLIESAVGLCNADRGMITRLKDGRFYKAEAFGFSPEFIDYYFRTVPLEPGRGTVTGRALLERKTVHVADVRADPEYTWAEGQKLGDFRAVVSAPMLREGIPIGVIVLNRSEPSPFTEKQIELVQTFADQAVIAIENVRLFEEVQARTEELTRALQQQTATADVLKVISRSAFDLDTVLTTLVQTAMQLCEAANGAIWLRRGEQLFLAAHAGVSPEWVRRQQENPITPAANSGMVAGLAAFTGELVNVEDIPNDPRFRSFEAHKMGHYRGGLAIPLKREGRVEGVIGLSRLEARLFTPRQCELVQTFADQAVIAIENVRLFEEVQARTEELGVALQQQTATADVLKVISRSAFDLQTVLDTLTESAARLCEADMAGITRRKDDGFYYATSYNFPSDWLDFVKGVRLTPGRGSVVGRSLLEGRVVHVTDVLADPEYTYLEPAKKAGYRTFLGVPLLREGQPIGVLALARTRIAPFTDGQIELLESFADQAVIAIENVRLFDEVQARTTELTEALEQQTATADVLKVISRSAFDLQVVLDTLLESAARLCRADKADMVRFIDGAFHYVATYGYTPELEAVARSYPLKVDRGSANGRAMAEKRTIHIVDVLSDPEYRMSHAAREVDFRTVLAVPLLREGNLVGIIALLRAEVRPFSEKEIEFVTTFADQAVIAIENVRLFDEVQARTTEVSEALKQQTATADVLKVISRSAFDLPAVLEALVASAAELCNTSYGGIFLREGDRLRGGALFGGSTKDDAEIKAQSMPIDRKTISGRVALSGQVEHIPDILDDPEYDVSFMRHWGSGQRAMMGVPLLREGKVEGVFFLGRPEPGSFTERQSELVTTFADQAVIAIENVRLFDEVQARTRDLEEALQQQTATADVLKVISRSAFDLNGVLQTLINSACKLCAAERAGSTCRTATSTGWPPTMA
jgi:GAF domain-containing protein